jgi:hypothetical protein
MKSKCSEKNKTFIQSGLGNKNPRKRFTLPIHSLKIYGRLNGEHSPKFTQQVSLEYQRWLAERFILFPHSTVIDTYAMRIY